MSTTTDNLQAIGATALNTVAALAPALAVLDPKAAALLAISQEGIKFLSAALALSQAGIIPADQLAVMWGAVGTGVQGNHAKWGAMNAADAAAKTA